jgi:hypothetical protein
MALRRPVGSGHEDLKVDHCQLEHQKLSQTLGDPMKAEDEISQGLDKFGAIF